MKKQLSCLLSIIIFTTLLIGCWSKRELNELALASAIGIDKSDNGYLVTVQIVNPTEIAGQKSAGKSVPVITLRTTGKTISEALRRSTVVSPRRIYTAHIRVVVLGEDLARDGIADVLDFLARDHEMRTDFYILVAKDVKAEAVLSILTVLEDIPAFKIFSALETSDKTWAATHSVQLDELITNIVHSGINPVLTGVLLSGNADIGMNTESIHNTRPPALLKIGNLGAFKKDKLVGWLNEEESIGYNAIVGNIKSSVTTIPFPEGGMLTVEVMKAEVDINSKLVNGEPRIELNYRAEGNVGEVQCDIDLTKQEGIEKIEALWNDLSTKRLKNVIKRVQEDFESDIFGFGEAFHRQNPKAWKSLQKNWDTEFINLPVDIKVNSKIKRIGTTINPIEGKE